MSRCSSRCYLEFNRKLKETEPEERLKQGDRIAVLEPALPPNRASTVRIKPAVAGSAASLLLALVTGIMLEQRDPMAATERRWSPFRA